MRESKVEDYFCKRIRDLGGETRKLKWIGRRSAPDQLAMLPPVSEYHGDKGTHFLAEIKRPGEVAEEHQAREHERLRAAGFEVYVIDSIEAVDRYFPLN